MNLDAFRHKVSQSQQHRSQLAVCTKCGLISRFHQHPRGFCEDFVFAATNATFGTSFVSTTPIPILADFVEERDDGTEEFAELVKFLRGITPKRSINEFLHYVTLTEVVWGL